MTRLGRKLGAMLFGNYIVLESKNYGLHKNHRKLGRFANIDEAKAFASNESKRLRNRVVVMAADTLAKMYVYQPKAQHELHLAHM